MELYIKNNRSDITYMSELIPAVSLCEAKRNKAAGINSQTAPPTTYVTVVP